MCSPIGGDVFPCRGKYPELCFLTLKWMWLDNISYVVGIMLTIIRKSTVDKPCLCQFFKSSKSFLNYVGKSHPQCQKILSLDSTPKSLLFKYIDGFVESKIILNTRIIHVLYFCDNYYFNSSISSIYQINRFKFGYLLYLK